MTQRYGNDEIDLFACHNFWEQIDISGQDISAEIRPRVERERCFTVDIFRIQSHRRQIYTAPEEFWVNPHTFLFPADIDLHRGFYPIIEIDNVMVEHTNTSSRAGIANRT